MSRLKAQLFICLNKYGHVKIGDFLLGDLFADEEEASSDVKKSTYTLSLFLRVNLIDVARVIA